MRIIQLSDIHVGPSIGKDQVDVAVRIANAQHPDLVLITGDLIDGNPAKLEPTLQALGHLDSKLGALFVTGNHEYISGVHYLAEWVDILAKLGIRTLSNERLLMPATALQDPLNMTGTWWSSRDGTPEPTYEGVYFAGVHDYSAKGRDDEWAADMGAALAGRNTSRATVLMAHQPNHSDEAEEHGVNLQLSGHTHEGQLWPIHLVTYLGNTFFAGHYRVSDVMQVYVNRGTNQWGPPARIGSWREITLFEVSPE